MMICWVGSNVQCTEEDNDITQCKAEKLPHLENACTHEQDVGLRCYEPQWAGVRLGVLAERTDLQYVTVQKAGLLDYATNTFKPGTITTLTVLETELKGQ